MVNRSRRMAHETHDPHAHHHHESNNRLFFRVFYEAVVHITFVAIFVELVELYTLHGPPAIFNFQARAS